jgi:hypothetical protein
MVAIKSEEEKLIQNLSGSELRTTLEKVVEEQNNKASETMGNPDRIKDDEYLIHWDLTPGFPGDKDQKKLILEMLTALKIKAESNTSLHISKQPEVIRALKELNKDPDAAKNIFDYLLTQTEIMSSDTIQTELLKISSYLHIDQEDMVDLAEKVINSNILESSTTKIHELDSQAELIKIREATNIILINKSHSKENLMRYIKQNINSNTHPLIKEDYLNHLEIYYPDEALKLRQQDKNEGNESIDEYLKKETDN